jgi:hypothetical protein
MTDYLVVVSTNLVFLYIKMEIGVRFRAFPNIYYAFGYSLPDRKQFRWDREI